MLLVNYVCFFLFIFLWVILAVFFCKQVHYTTIHESYTFFIVPRNTVSFYCAFIFVSF